MTANPSDSKVSHHWSIDGIEEGIARIDTGGDAHFTLPSVLLPPGATEGQMLRVTLELDTDATRRALEKSTKSTKAALDESRKRDPGGDVVL